MRIGPQREKASFWGNVPSAWTLVIDLTTAGWQASGIAIMNFDNNTRLYVSFDGGVTPDLILDPRRNRGIALPDHGLPQGTVHAMAAAGSVETNIYVWS